MRSIEDKSCYNLGEVPGGSSISFEFHKGNGGGTTANRSSHHRAGLGKPRPSKWDDAQKWLVGLSRGGEKNSNQSQPRNSNADDRRLIAPVPQKEQDYYEVDEVGRGNGSHPGMGDQYEVETKKMDCDEPVWRVNKHVDGSVSATSGVRSICVRDMGTEMTPIASQEPSRSATPVRATTPVARSPISSGSTTPVRSLQTDYVAASRGSLDSRTNGEQNDSEHAQKLSPLESRAVAWDEAERAKYMARYKREEVKIQAWENHEKRKAEMEMKKIEARAERLKARAQEKCANKLTAARRIAEEKRVSAEAKLNEKAVQTSERADYIRRTGHLPSSFSCSFKLPSLCW